MSELFSIIIPVFNVEQFLDKCLKSVISQVYPNYEVILIDDGSTDKSGDICDEYARKYKHFKVIHQENRGLAAARNKGLSCANGKYIIFLDSDDYLEKEMLFKVYEQMEHQGYDICSFASRRIDEQEHLLYEMRFEDMAKEIVFDDDSKDYFLKTVFLQYQVGWEVCFHVYKKEIIDENNIRFDESVKYAEDIPFTFEYMLYVTKWIKIPDVLYNYLYRRGSITKEVDCKRMIYGLMIQDLSLIINGLDKKDSCRYNMVQKGMIFSSMLLYFYDVFMQGVDINELRDLLINSENTPVTEELLNAVIKNSKELCSLFGKDREKKIYNIVCFLKDGNIIKFRKRERG